MFYTWIKWSLGLRKSIPLCSYCIEEQENPLHLFHSCLKAEQLWNKLRQYFSQFTNIPHFTPQSSILGIFDNNQHSELINNLLLIFKFYIYSARNTEQLNFDNLKITIKGIKEIKKELSSSNKLKEMTSYWSYDWLILRSKWRGRGAGACNFISFSILFFFFCLFVCLVFFVCPVLSCFINFIFDIFVISYSMFFVVIERKKTLLKKKKRHDKDMVNSTN